MKYIRSGWGIHMDYIRNIQEIFREYIYIYGICRKYTGSIYGIYRKHVGNI